MSPEYEVEIVVPYTYAVDAAAYQRCGEKGMGEL